MPSSLAAASSQEELGTTAISFKKAAGFAVETMISRESFVEVARAG